MEIVNVLGYQTSIESLLLDMNNFYLGQLGFTINAFVHQKGRFLPTISVDSVGDKKSHGIIPFPAPVSFPPSFAGFHGAEIHISQVRMGRPKKWLPRLFPFEPSFIQPHPPLPDCLGPRGGPQQKAEHGLAQLRGGPRQQQNRPDFFTLKSDVGNNLFQPTTQWPAWNAGCRGRLGAPRHGTSRTTW